MKTRLLLFSILLLAGSWWAYPARAIQDPIYDYRFEGTCTSETASSFEGCIVQGYSATAYEGASSTLWTSAQDQAPYLYNSNQDPPVLLRGSHTTSFYVYFSSLPANGFTAYCGEDVRIFDIMQYPGGNTTTQQCLKARDNGGMAQLRWDTDNTTIADHVGTAFDVTMNSWHSVHIYHNYETTSTSVYVDGVIRESNVTTNFGTAPNVAYRESVSGLRRSSGAHSALIDRLIMRPGEPFDTDSIEITFPEDSSSIPDFYDWEVGYSTATSTTGTEDDVYIQEIYVGDSPSTLTDISGQNAFPATEAGASASIGKFQVFYPGQTIYAQARQSHYNGSTDTETLVATSTIISFSVIAPASSTLPLPPEFASSTCTGYGFVGEPLCKVALWLFLPSDNAVDKFKEIGDLVSSKPPMGYFSLVKTAIEGVATTTTSTVALPDLSDLDEPFLNPIRTALQALIWFFFAFWLFHRLRHLQL